MATLDEILGGGRPTQQKSDQASANAVTTVPVQQPVVQTTDQKPTEGSQSFEARQSTSDVGASGSPAAVTHKDNSSQSVAVSQKVGQGAPVRPADVIGMAAAAAAPKQFVPGNVNAPRLSYVQMYEMMNRDNRPETPEERAKREKKEKREAVISAIGDGISAMSNLSSLRGMLRIAMMRGRGCRPRPVSVGIN